MPPERSSERQRERERERDRERDEEHATETERLREREKDREREKKRNAHLLGHVSCGQTPSNESFFLGRGEGGGAPMQRRIYFNFKNTQKLHTHAHVQTRTNNFPHATYECIHTDTCVAWKNKLYL